MGKGENGCAFRRKKCEEKVICGVFLLTDSGGTVKYFVGDCLWATRVCISSAIALM